MLANLTARQARELEYHRTHAEAHRSRLETAVSFAVVQSDRRRWWNAYWSTYDLIRSADLQGKRVLVLGCGAGDDVIRLASLGAEAYGCDLSADLLAFARGKADRAGLPCKLDVMPAERMTYPDAFFDAVLFIDILHHVDIPGAVQEIRRVLKPSALVIGNELYTHSSLQRVRESGPIARWLYPRMVRFIYGTDTPYITEDEHKIDESEFALIANGLSDLRCAYFGAVASRVLPDWTWLAKIDRLFMRSLGRCGSWLGGRVVFAGRVTRSHGLLPR